MFESVSTDPKFLSSDGTHAYFQEQGFHCVPQNAIALTRFERDPISENIINRRGRWMSKLWCLF